MSFTFREVLDCIKLNKRTIKVNISVASGKEGDYYVFVSPSLLVSGYGDNLIEARKSFEENIKTFCEDLLSLPENQRFQELKNLGFRKDKLFNQKFSKAYIDEKGFLHGIEAGTLKSEILDASF